MMIQLFWKLKNKSTRQKFIKISELAREIGKISIPDARRFVKDTEDGSKINTEIGNISIFHIGELITKPDYDQHVTNMQKQYMIQNVLKKQPQAIKIL